MMMENRVVVTKLTVISIRPPGADGQVGEGDGKGGLWGVGGELCKWWCWLRAGMEERDLSGVLATWLSAGGACMYRLSVHCAAEVHLWLVAGVVADANFVTR